MPPACGVGITSIPREIDLTDNVKACVRFHNSMNCSKPSQKPKVSAARDLHWKEKKKPDLFFDSRRYLSEAKRDSSKDKELISSKALSVTAAACAGGSTYVELLQKQMGY